jgi:pimeloyl-ACP methyl ester carboxylesterase
VIRIPEVRYANNGDLHIAYQVLGDSPRDLVFVAGFTSHCEHQWEEPSLARSLERMASFSRLIWFDKRGTGLSDPIFDRDQFTLEQRMDDMRAVMDAAGSERATILGASEGGAMAALFAATYPERVSGLILYASWARTFQASDYPYGPPEATFESILEMGASSWGHAGVLPVVAPSAAGDARMQDWWARWERLSCSPGTARRLLEVAFQIDIRDVLSAIHVPTLVIHRTGDRFAPVEHGRYLAAHIPGARYVELPGVDHPHFVGDVDSIMDEVAGFVTGQRAPHATERTLVTVLFTDIVGSTERAAQIGDQAWRDLLEAHNAAVRRELFRFRGKEIDRAGDGFLATFDGPARGVACGRAIVESCRRLGLEIRAGVHTGEIEQQADGSIAGLAVHIGARVAAAAQPGEVLVSRTVRDLVIGSGLHFTERGEFQLKGVPGEWQLLSVA